MNLDINRAVRMTWTGDRWFEKILIGVLVWIVASAVGRLPGIGGLAHLLVLSLATGYAVSVMRQESHAAADALPRSLPEWKDWQDLLKDGLVITALHTLYGLVLVLLFALAVGALGAGRLVTQYLGGHDVALPAAVVLIAVAFGMAGLLLYGLFIPMMTAHYAHERRLSAVFEFGTIFGKLFANLGNVALAVLTAIGLAVATVILALTVIGMPIAIFMSQVILADVWAQVYRQAQSKAKPSA